MSGLFLVSKRFDGVRFVTFDPSNTPELQHARIRHLDLDAAGTLWISTFYGSLTSYRDGQFASKPAVMRMACG